VPNAYRFDIVLLLEKPLILIDKIRIGVPLLAMLLSLFLLQDQRRFTTLLLLAFLNAHIFLTNLGADGAYRHAVAVEWIYWALLMAGGASWIARQKNRTTSK
jgi:hypothetical protein